MKLLNGFSRFARLSTLVVLSTFLPSCTESDLPPKYLDATASLEERVQDLLGRMTLEEKVGQINMPCMYLSQMGKSVQDKMSAAGQFAAGKYVEGIGPSGGFFTLANNLLHEGPRQQALFYNSLQKIATEETRLRIPLNQIEEGTHGLMASGATVFPEGPGLGSTWNMDLIEKVYSSVAAEARAVGVHQIFTLVIEPNRDPRLGRNEEGYSEDPYLCSRIAERIVMGTQGSDVSALDKVVAGLCHYPGQGQAEGGMERGAMLISERTLRNVFLPPWIAGIKKAGALGVMATYPAIDGIPVHSSDYILTQILRNELGFDGIVTGEGSGITTLVYERVAADQKEAGAMAIKAGVDVGISFEEGFMQGMIANIQDGTVPVELLDRAVSRVLSLKFRQGLFERPYVDPDRAEEIVHSTEHQDLALQAAREAIVLLKNEGNLLPLAKNLKRIAVIGPNADHDRNQLGDYIANTVTQDVVTVLEGIRGAASPQTEIISVRGCDVVGTETNELTRAAQAARSADVAIVVVGENERKDPQGTNGEGKDVSSLDLTGMQRELIQAVQKTGTPVVVVLINGRPLSVPWVAENVPAVLEAWLPGERGGLAVAEILFGDTNPSGRLPLTIPRSVGQLPIYYSQSPARAFWTEKRGYIDGPSDPLFEFGYGLSYTTFEYSNLSIGPESIGPDDQVRIGVEVTNTGSRSGQEVVQLYINDLVSSVTTPVIELKGFQKIHLDPGQTKTVEFELQPEDISLLNREMRRVVEPGSFEVMVGRSSRDIALRGSFEVGQENGR